jgi:hypothetical protein
LGQGTNATLSGTVSDENGASVPGVGISVINSATSLERTANTSDNGAFTIPLLPPGSYVVTAKRDGFSPVKIAVVLNVGDQKALNIQLKAGDVNAQVTIDSDAETVRTDGSVGTVVNRQFVANIPLNGRSLQALIQLVPGVVLTSNTGTSTSGAQFSVNGNRTTANQFIVDGVSANTGIRTSGGQFPAEAGSGQSAATTALGGTNSLVSLDALQEFRVETSSYAAEFGRTPGGQILLLTRGGTNQFHGSASYYVRNEALDANDWFGNANRQPKPKERQHLFGGVFGGPIKRDRLFFFGSYEGLRLQQPKVTITTVPSVALRALAVPALRPYLNAYPLPNGRDLGDGTAQFAASYSDPGRFNIFALRFDARLTDSLNGFFRINHAPSETNVRFKPLSTVQSVLNDENTYTGGLTWLVSSRSTADVRINWTRNLGRFFSNLDTFGGAVIPAVSDIFLPGRDPSKASFSFAVIGQGFTWGVGTSDVQRQFNVVGTATWLIGSHHLKLGLDYRRLLPFLGVTSGSFEDLEFETVDEVLTQQATFYQVTNSDTVPREAIISNLSLFAQDTWHAGQRLTLTYGFRFERVPPPTEASGRLPRTVLGLQNGVLQNPRLAPEGTPLFRSRFGEIAPRFGVAYQMSTGTGWETTLRGGAGIFYDLPLGSIATAFHNVYPFFASKEVCCDMPFPLSPDDRTPPRLGVDPPQQFILLDPNVRMPYSIQWNTTLEQRIGAAQVITVAYVGAAGRRLLVLQPNSQSLAEWPGVPIAIYFQRNLGRSKYDALQVQYNRRLRNGVQAIASYTLGHSRDNASQVSAIFTPPAAQSNLFAEEYAPSDFDVRHLLSAAVTYDLPRISGPVPLRWFANGWGLDLLVRYQSAFPINLTAGFLSANGTFYIPRPNLVTGQPLYIDDPTAPGGRRFNRAAFVRPAAGQQGNFPRNVLRGFPASQVDLAMRREFRLKEQVRLEFRGELFNLFNHPNFGPPVNSITSGLFGRPTSMLNQSLGGLNGLYQMGGPRSGQLAVRLTW